MTKKSNILKIDLFDYIFYGGYFYLPYRQLFSQNELDKINDEKWSTKDAIAYTLDNVNWRIEFVYLTNNTYSHDVITIFHNNKTLKQFKKEFQIKYPNMKYKAFCSDEYLVFIYDSGIRVFFQITGKNYFLNKLYSKSDMLEVEKKFIIDTMIKVDL